MAAGSQRSIMNAPRPRPWYRTAPRRRLLRRLPASRSARALVVLCAALVAAVTIAALAWLWYGTPYPQSDPDRIAVRLKDQAQSDVRSFRLAWQVRAVPEDVALSGLQRMRARLEREGRTLVDTGVDRSGFRFRDPAGEGDVQQVEHVDARWYRETGTYTVSAYAGCGKLPDGFYEYMWPERDWAPEAGPGTPVTPPAARSATPR